MKINKLKFNNETKQIEYELKNSTDIKIFDIRKLYCKEFKNLLEYIFNGKPETKVICDNSNYFIYYTSLRNESQYYRIQLVYFDYTSEECYTYIIPNTDPDNCPNDSDKFMKLLEIVVYARLELKDIDFIE